jgi:hypothetical protein
LGKTKLDRKENVARIWVLSASISQRREVDTFFASVGVLPIWKPQPHQPMSFQTIVEMEHDPASISSNLAKIGAPFEIEGAMERYLYHPGLGIKRQQLDESGEVVLRVGQLKQELLESNSSAVEFERRLRVLEGQAWLDMLEPYRLGTLRYDQMPRAV